jgi:hypothetical protein
MNDRRIPNVKRPAASIITQIFIRLLAKVILG